MIKDIVLRIVLAALELVAQSLQPQVALLDGKRVVSELFQTTYVVLSTFGIPAGRRDRRICLVGHLC